MVSSMAKKLIKSLVSSQFYVTPVLGNGYIDENFSVLLMKVDSPILYVVAVISDERMNLDEYSKYLESYLNNLKGELSSYYCSNIICLNLIVDNITNMKAVDFVDKKDYFPDGNIHCLWWAVSISEKEIYAGKNQPKKLLNISDLINELMNNLEFDAEENSENSIINIQTQTVIKTAMQKKSKYATMTWSICFINIAIFLIMLFLGRENIWVTTFANDAYSVSVLGEYYRLITSIFLHGGIFHLISNSLYLLVFGRNVELYLGKATFFIIYFTAGIAGSVLSVLNNTGFSIGASGAIFGLMSSILVLSYKKGKAVIGMNVSTLILLIVVVILSGFLDSNVDNLAHVGGFLGGGIVSWFFISDKNE